MRGTRQVDKIEEEQAAGIHIPVDKNYVDYSSYSDIKVIFY